MSDICELLNELAKCDKILTEIAGKYYTNDCSAWRGTVSERLSYIINKLSNDYDETYNCLFKTMEVNQ